MPNPALDTVLKAMDTSIEDTNLPKPYIKSTVSILNPQVLMNINGSIVKKTSLLYIKPAIPDKMLPKPTVSLWKNLSL